MTRPVGQWLARSKSTLLNRFLNVLVSVMSWRSEGKVLITFGQFQSEIFRGCDFTVD